MKRILALIAVMVLIGGANAALLPATSAGEMKVESLTATPATSPLGGEVYLTATVFNSDPVNERYSQFEACLFPVEWSGNAFTAFSIIDPQRTSCCASNTYCGATTVRLEPNERDTVTIKVYMPNQYTMDGCNNLGSAASPSNRYQSVSGFYCACYGQAGACGYSSSKLGPIVTAQTDTCYYGQACQTGGCPGTWECTPSKFCKDIPNDNCPNQQTTTTTTIPPCVAGILCYTPSGCPGYRTCPGNACVDTPGDDCPANTCTQGSACTTPDNCPGQRQCPSNICTDTPGDNCPAGATCDNDKICEAGEPADTCADCKSPDETNWTLIGGVAVVIAVVAYTMKKPSSEETNSKKPKRKE